MRRPFRIRLTRLAIGAVLSASFVPTLIANAQPANASPAPVVTAGLRFTPLVPHRIFDSRNNSEFGEKLSPKEDTTMIIVVGNDIPLGTEAVSINVTATEGDAAGYLTVYPCPKDVKVRPKTSNVNFIANYTAPVEAFVKVGERGAICIWANVNVHAIIDINGFFHPTVGSLFTANPAARLFDTRDGTNTKKEKLVPGKPFCFPMGSKAMLMNVTMVNPEGPGYLTQYPAGVQPPLASNLNSPYTYAVTSNMTVSGVGPGGVCWVSNVKTDLLADPLGFFSANGTKYLYVMDPLRVLDTRSGTGLKGAFKTGESRDLDMCASSGLSRSGARTLVLSLTATEEKADGFITAWAMGDPKPQTSALNYVTTPEGGRTVANQIMVTTDSTGCNVSLYAHGATDLVADLVGYFQ